jgi:hypothetical protein
MVEIRDFYEGINFVTIPKVIIDELKTHSDLQSFVSTRNKERKIETTYTGYQRPVFMRFSKYNFWLNPIYYESLLEKLNNGNCFDTHNNKVDHKNIDLFYSEYSKGFYKGYNEFENSLKSNVSIFSISNEQISYRIYARIKEHFPKQKNGQFKIYAESFEQNEMKLIFKESNFFESGVNGGEFYKAWEIILNNPTIFEPIFTANKPKTPTIDLSDATATEKNVSNFDPNHFNQKGYELFLYLVENYDKKGNIKFINIYEFMKKSPDKTEYGFRFTQQKYTAFILSNYGIEIKKYKVADFKYIDVEKPILNGHEQRFSGR